LFYVVGAVCWGLSVLGVLLTSPHKKLYPASLVEVAGPYRLSRFSVASSATIQSVPFL